MINPRTICLFIWMDIEGQELKILVVFAVDFCHIHRAIFNHCGNTCWAWVRCFSFLGGQDKDSIARINVHSKFLVMASDDACRSFYPLLSLSLSLCLSLSLSLCFSLSPSPTPLMRVSLCVEHSHVHKNFRFFGGPKWNTLVSPIFMSVENKNLPLCSRRLCTYMLSVQTMPSEASLYC